MPAGWLAKVIVCQSSNQPTKWNDSGRIDCPSNCLNVCRNGETLRRVDNDTDRPQNAFCSLTNFSNAKKEICKTLKHIADTFASLAKSPTTMNDYADAIYPARAV